MTVNVPIVPYPVDPAAMVEAGRVVEGLRVALNRTDGTLTELVTQLLEERAELLLTLHDRPDVVAGALDAINRAGG